MIANTEQIEAPPASTGTEPKATKTAQATKRGANVAPQKTKSGKNATLAKKAPKARKGEKADSTRDRSKAATILRIRPDRVLIRTDTAQKRSIPGQRVGDALLETGVVQIP